MREMTTIANLAQKVHLIRGYNVILDDDLAVLYETETRLINRAVQRNIERFPTHFMFQITSEEFTMLPATTDPSTMGRGKHRKFMPFAFTEHGVAMLSGVINTKIAYEINVSIIETFIHLRNSVPKLHEQVAVLLNDQIPQVLKKLDDISEAVLSLPTASNNTKPTPAPLENQIEHQHYRPTSSMTVHRIQLLVSTHFGIGIKQLLSPVRTHSIAFPRQVAIYLVRKNTSLSYKEIAQLFGGKDHTTILFACRKVETILHDDASLRETIESIIRSLSSPKSSH